jgi:amino acid transporter
MGIITYFIPYLYVFASMFKVQKERAGPEVIRVPGGRPVARFMACVGFASTLFTIGLSLVPSPDETNKLLAVIKIVGLSGVLLGTGWLLYFLGNRKRRAAAAGA